MARRRLCLRCLSLAVVAALTAPAIAAEVGLVNGDFEQPELTPELVPVGWHIDQRAPWPSVHIQRQALLTHGGHYGVRIADFSPDAGYSLRSRLYPAVPGESYEASAWVHNASGDGWLYLEFYRAPGQRASEQHRGCGVTGDWRQIAVRDVCPPDGRYVAVLLYSAIGNVGEAAWDDVALTGPAGEGEAVNLDAEGAQATVDWSYLYNVGDRKQLLFDDVFFAEHKGFWWRVCPPHKTGERNLVADKPWESFLINWLSVMQDEGKLRMWYECYDSTYSGDQNARYCYAESADGITWTKPNLGLVEFQGSKDNNILFHGLGGLTNHGGTVFRDPQAPPAERYKFIFYGLVQPGGDQYRVCGGYSADGIHWQRYDKAPILDVESDTQQAAFWDERIGKYVAYCRLWTPDRTIGRSESTDFLNFPPAVEVLGCDDRDPPDTDMYNSAAMKYPYAENAYFIFTSMYYHPSDTLDIHLAVSRDGVHWTRPERRPFIENGPPGSLDDATAYMAPGLVRQGDELWHYYFASRARHNQVYPQWESYGSTYTRVTLPLDRYVALDASAMPATFTTHPLTFTGSRLEVNADVRAGGYARFELRDEAGQPLPGFALADCESLAGDSLRHAVTWAGADLAALAGRPVVLHCEARDASLYAFQFAP